MSPSWITWNPNRYAFTIPYINHPIAWYGIFFTLGFIIGYFLMVRIFQTLLKYTQILAPRDFPKKVSQQTIEAINARLTDPKDPLTRENVHLQIQTEKVYSLKELAQILTDKLAWFVIAGTIIGARLGHVFFYDWPRYQDNLVDILKVWEGGLASHGGAIGVLIALYLYIRHIQASFPEVTFIKLLDSICIPTALVACFIRIGNFWNQEILGTKSSLPWAVIFEDPADGGGVYPRHPVQLYEAYAYLCTFFILIGLWKKNQDHLKPGFLIGLFFVLIFTSRFVLEFFKAPQSIMIDESFIQTGQLLSIPFIIAGIWLMMRKQNLKSY